MSVSVCLSVRLSVTEVHYGHGARREKGRGHLALCYPLLGPLVNTCTQYCVFWMLAGFADNNSHTPYHTTPRLLSPVTFLSLH